MSKKIIKTNTLMGDNMSLVPSIRYSVSFWQYCFSLSFNVKNFSTQAWTEFIRSFLNHTLETTLLSNTSACTYDLTVMFSNRVLLLRKLMEKHDVNEKLSMESLHYKRRRECQGTNLENHIERCSQHTYYQTLTTCCWMWHHWRSLSCSC